MRNLSVVSSQHVCLVRMVVPSCPVHLLKPKILQDDDDGCLDDFHDDRN